MQAGTVSGRMATDPEAAVLTLLEEARYVLSGMVYGFRFTYTPSDETRRVPEVFVLDAVAQIEPGDPALTVPATRLQDTRLEALFRYTLAPEQRQWRGAWSGGTVAKAGGVGTGSLFLGQSERLTALRNAVKDSIRNHLRPMVLNKPREVSGDLLLWEVGPTRAAAGTYTTRVVTRLRVRSLLPYRVF